MLQVSEENDKNVATGDSLSTTNTRASSRRGVVVVSDESTENQAQKSGCCT